MVEAVIEGEPSAADTLYFNHPGVAVVTWHPTSQAIHVEWQGWAHLTERVACLEAGLRALTEHHGSRWLVDGREMKAVKQSDQDWIDQDWFPRALAAGLRRMAVVMPKSRLAGMNVDDILARVPDSKLEVARFATVAQARERLMGSLQPRLRMDRSN